MSTRSLALTIASLVRSFHDEHGTYPRWLYLGHAEMAALKVAPDIDIPGMKSGNTTLHLVEMSSHLMAVGLDSQRPGEWTAAPLW